MAHGAVQERSSTVALLGPTNTGKTHRAVERMLEHHCGMIGLPLRLLAREIYDRVSARVGERAVALVTGEEKRIPAAPRYWVCTVESMPVDRPVDFLAVDEVQLAAHPQRGHVFTDRLLYARGNQETWFLGSDTMRSMLEELVPTARVERHPRLSKLSAAGSLGMSALPPRTAVIAFSAAEVYAIAERLRRRRGGAAVVLGALSPRTRNAQVAMYQSGEVDFMVATDAVGMGLNMDVDHVAFASLQKYDGFRVRGLSPAELGQIAGRAGRYTRQGSFGALRPLELPSDIAFAVETHRFAPVRSVMWRNSDLDTRSLAALLESLSARPRRRVLTMVENASDMAVLRLLSQRPSVQRLARDADAVRLLWEVCRIPDFRKLLVEHHANLLEEIFLQLAGPRGRLDPDFMHQRIARLENDGGDIDTLLMRMEFIRTWSYIAHHGSWVPDAASWQARTRSAEDRLSQALHERLIERFVEDGGRRRRRGGGSRGRPPRQREALDASTSKAAGPFAELIRLRASLAPELVVPAHDGWVDEVVEAQHHRFRVGSGGRVSFEGVELGRLARGTDRLHPEVKLTLARELGAGARSRIARRLRAWVRDLVDETLGPIRDPRVACVGAAGRGLLYQLEQGLGTIEVRAARDQLAELAGHERALFAEIGVVLGRRLVFAVSSLEPETVLRRALLCEAFDGQRVRLPEDGAPSMPAQDRELSTRIGYPVFGPRAIRADLAERLDERLASMARGGAFQPDPHWAAWLAIDPEELERVVAAFGYRVVEAGFVPARRRRRRRPS